MPGRQLLISGRRNSAGFGPHKGHQPLQGSTPFATRGGPPRVQAPVPPLPEAGGQRRLLQTWEARWEAQGISGVLPIAALGCVWLRRGGELLEYQVPAWTHHWTRWTCSRCTVATQQQHLEVGCLAPDPCALAASHLLAPSTAPLGGLLCWGLFISSRIVSRRGFSVVQHCRSRSVGDSRQHRRPPKTPFSRF